jgi:hypothetical protein
MIQNVQMIENWIGAALNDCTSMHGVLPALEGGKGSGAFPVAGRL